MGSATLSPEGEFEVGSHQTFKLVYTAGKFGIDDQGGLRIGFRGHFDGSQIQFDKPKVAGYTTVKASNGALLEACWEMRRNIRPWNKSLYIRCLRFLQEGDKIEIVFGDKSEGSPGWQMQTFCESAFTFQITVDPFATQDFIALPSDRNPKIAITSGNPSAWKMILPTLRRPNESFRLSIKADDIWGNPSNRLYGDFTLKSSAKIDGLPERVSIKPGIFSKVIDNLSVAVPGRIIITMLDEEGITIVNANPLEIQDSPVAHFWSDMHAQSGETIGVGTAREYFDFARNKAFLDIAGHQGNDFQITDSFWDHLNDLTKEFNEDGRFLALPGYEWSGNTGLGGDHNVWYRDEGRPIYRSSRALVNERANLENDAHSTPDLIEKLSNENVLVVAHVGGRYADIKYAHDARLEPSVEVHSSWGTFEWILRDAFESGYRVGVVASSDGHKGRPGAEYPGDSQFGSFGGLTCHLLQQLDRDNFFDAFRKRRHYATTGARIFMDVYLILGEQKIEMGSIVDTDKECLELNFNVVGTAPLEKIEIFDGLELLNTVRLWDEKERMNRFRVTCAGQHYRGRGRLVKWDVSAKFLDGKILRFLPINFWNPNRQPRMLTEREVRWKTVTTGGFSSVDFWLNEKALRGKCAIETNFESIFVDIDNLTEEGVSVDCGGMDVRIHVEKLPEVFRNSSHAGSLQIPLERGSERRLYIRITQEDGHQAWSSPIYVSRAKE